MRAIVKQAPRHLLEVFCETYCARNMEACLALFAKDAFFWGTGLDETRRGLSEIEDQFMRDWSQSESCQFKIEHVEEDPENPNWVGATLSACVNVNGVIQTLILRGIVITSLENGEHKIRFCHTSFPAINQPIGESFPCRKVGQNY